MSLDIGGLYWKYHRMAKDRSPKSPRNSLKSAVDAVGKLFLAAKRAPLPRDAAARAMGYAGLTGVSATILGSLGGYGLIQKRGGDIGVSDLAISILHPTGPDQRKAALKQAALMPPLFAQLAEHFLEVDPAVLSSRLVQMGFSPDAAKITAKVFHSNASFAELSDDSHSDLEEDNDFDEDERETGIDSPQPSPNPNYRQSVIVQPVAAPRNNVLATYRIPLGSNEAELVFTGESLEPADFDALIDYVEIFKKQFERKKITQPNGETPSPVKNTDDLDLE